MNRKIRRFKKHKRARYYILRNQKIFAWCLLMLILVFTTLPVGSFIKLIMNPVFAMNVSDDVFPVMTPTKRMRYVSMEYPSAGVIKSEEEFMLLPLAGVSAKVDKSVPEAFTVVGYGKNIDLEKILNPEPVVVVKKEIKKENKKQEVNSEEKPDVSAINSSVNLTDEFISLCAMIHLEAGEGATLQSKTTVANVATNRLKDKVKWGYNTLTDVLYAPNQFSVVRSHKFAATREKLKSGNWDANMQNSITAAQLAYSGSSTYDIPDDVQFFYGDPNKRSWGKHTYCFTIGGNSFFK